MKKKIKFYIDKLFNIEKIKKGGTLKASNKIFIKIESTRRESQIECPGISLYALLETPCTLPAYHGPARSIPNERKSGVA